MTLFQFSSFPPETKRYACRKMKERLKAEMKSPFSDAQSVYCDPEMGGLIKRERGEKEV